MIKLNKAQKNVAKEIFETLFTAILLAVLIRSFIIQPYKIPTGSMEPTLMPGDRILVLRYVYGFRIPFTFKRVAKFKSPKIGDIVVFNYPKQPKRAFIKRCIGLENDRLQIQDGSIWRNDEPLKVPPINKFYYYNRGQHGIEGNIIDVPQDHYFVLGDNSASSQDSRYWGPLDDKYLIGKAVLIYWPPRRIRILD